VTISGAGLIVGCWNMIRNSRKGEKGGQQGAEPREVVSLGGGGDHSPTKAGEEET